MRQIEKNDKNIFSKLKSKIRGFYRNKCFCVRNFIYKITKDMCFEEKEIIEVKNRVERTKESERKFNEFSNIAPEILKFIDELKRRNDMLEREKEFCMNGIRDIYIADRRGDEILKEKLFAKFGLPFVLNGEK